MKAADVELPKKAPELENSWLKKLPEEATPDIEALNEIKGKMVSSPSQRTQVDFTCERGLSNRSACDGWIDVRLRAHATQQGHSNHFCDVDAVRVRRVRIFRRPQGFELGRSRALHLRDCYYQRVVRAAGLPNAGRVRIPVQGKQVWTYDVAFDANASGQQIKYVIGDLSEPRQGGVATTQCPAQVARADWWRLRIYP